MSYQRWVEGILTVKYSILIDKLYIIIGRCGTAENSYQIRLPKPLYKNRPNYVYTRIEGYIDKGGMRTGFGITCYNLLK
jgi:hypothetical protein